MADLIERSEALDVLDAFEVMIENGEKHPYTWASKRMTELPAVDAVPVVHGRWLRVGHIEHTWLVSKCSVCGEQTIDAGNFCTNCGAKMEEVEHEAD